METNQLPRQITSKAEYYSLYEQGYFGNMPLVWNSLEECVDSGWKGGICIRVKTGVIRNRTKFDLNLEEAQNYIKQLKDEGISEKNLSFNQSMPNEELLIQGEIQRSVDNYWLTYTLKKQPMNKAFAEQTLHEKGIRAELLVKEHLFPSSYEDLQTLFDIFPDSTIEFSAYNIQVGNIPNRNTIFWEVRNY